MKTEIFEETNIKIGQNAQENWNLIDVSNQNYIWMHLNSFPSCYVVIENEDPSNELLVEGARLCKDNTKYKNMKDIKICYTTISNLIKGSNCWTISL